MLSDDNMECTDCTEGCTACGATEGQCDPDSCMWGYTMAPDFLTCVKCV